MAHLNSIPLPSNRGKGQIQIIFGPMFSGKTTELMRRLKRYQISKHKCLIIKYANDIRYDANGITTHDKQILPAVSATVLKDLKESALEYSVIGVDEGQFVEVIGGCEKYIATCRRCYSDVTPQKHSAAEPLKPIQENMESNDTLSLCKRRLLDNTHIPQRDADLSNKENSNVEMA
ncbi:hypothetical protein OTU49_006035 [Cherax quadricarinatus]|uniref:Thymidine kinase n=1 Tax=Cherax quadricarinatus TaxID=27406 RepID=A0AAW0X2L5_CHEQU